MTMQYNYVFVEDEFTTCIAIDCESVCSLEDDLDCKFTSPGYTDGLNYNAVTDCLWSIHAPENYRIRLDINITDIKGTGDECIGDRLEVYITVHICM